MTKRASETPEKSKARDPTPAEEAMLAQAKASQAARPARATLAVEHDVQKRAVSISNTHSDVKGWSAALAEAFGTSSDEYCHDAFARLTSVVIDKGQSLSNTQANSVLALMGAIAPRDELEAAIGAQIIACHVASLDFMQRARLNAGDYVASAASYTGMATKLSRTMAVHIEALAKLRSGGKQQVIVKHVYVDARGGQNVIAAELNQGGRGGSIENRLPHGPEALADLALAGGSEVLGEKPGREPLPVAGAEGAQEVSRPRRKQPQGA